MPKKSKKQISKNIKPRTTITILTSEYEKWKKLKNDYSWTTLLKTIREQYELFRSSKMVMSYKNELTTNSNELVTNLKPPPPPPKELNMNSKFPPMAPRNPRDAVMDELKELFKDKKYAEM